MTRLVTTPPERGIPVVLYDGQCPLCTEQAHRLGARAAGRIEVRSYHDAGVLARFPGLTADACQKEMHVVDASGSVRRGAEALLYAAQLAWRLPALAALYRVPGLRQLADAGYAAIARHRYRLFGRNPPCGDACRIHPRTPGGVSGTEA